MLLVVKILSGESAERKNYERGNVMAAVALASFI